MNDDRMKWLAGILAGASWFALVVMKLADVDTFVQFLQYFLVGVAAHGATMAISPRTPAPPPVAPAQGGYGSSILLFLIAVGCLVFLLSGCAGLNAQGVLTITYNTPAVKTDATLLPGMVLPGAKP